MIIHLADISIKETQDYLNHAIGPRPIAFVSTIDKNGKTNLSPFSYFNLFSVNPPVVIFSPSRRVRDNTTKHTLENIKEIPEAVISVVTYDIVQQASLASCEYTKETDEFIKAGFTPVKALHVQPPLVKESHINLECEVIDIKSLGENAGAGNLVICKIIYMHINDDILHDDMRTIDQTKLHHVARLGGDWYCKVDEKNLFKIARPSTKAAIGFDNLPIEILHSDKLTGNHLAQLANVEAIPDVDSSFNNMSMTFILKQYKKNPAKRNHELHKLASELLNNNLAEDAWQILLRSLEPVAFMKQSS